MLENNTNKKYVITTKGRNIGGSSINKEARELVNKFKILKKDVEEFANMRFMEIFYEDRNFEKPIRKKKK